MSDYRQFGPAAMLLVFVAAVIVPGVAGAGGFSFSDGFEDGDISDWTTVTAGTGVVEASMNRPLGGGLYSMHIKSVPQGDQAYALGSVAVFADLDYTRAYSIDFDFNYDKSNDPNGFHFLEVMAMNGPGAVSRQVGLYLDTPGVGDNPDKLIYRDAVPSNHNAAGLNEDVWYHLAIDVDPPAETYDLTLTGPAGTQQVYDWAASQWVNQVVISDIPFIGAGQSGAFFPFRFGDRNADGDDYDHGEAYWDNILIEGAVIPEPGALGLIGLAALALRKKRQQARGT